MCRVHSLVGQAVSPAKPYNAGIPKKVTPFPSKRCLRVPDLASLGITTRQSGFDCVPNTRPRLPGSGSCLRPARLGTAVAKRLPGGRSGGSSYSDRRWLEAFLSALCLGSDVKPRTSADSSSGPHTGVDEMVERIDGPKRKPDSGADRAAVLAGRVLRPLPAPFQSDRWRDRLH